MRIFALAAALARNLWPEGAPEEAPGKSEGPEVMTEASNFPTGALPSADGTQPPEP